MRTITTYVAFDGTEFSDKRECKEYEDNLDSDFFMWDPSGHTTQDTGKAMVVYLKGEAAAEKFIDECREQGESYNGITPDDMGLFIWMFGEYGYVDSDCYEGLLSSLNQVIAEGRAMKKN